MNDELLEILCCPETHQALHPAGADVISGLLDRQKAGTLKNRADQPVTEAFEGALIREDGKWAYRIQAGIPVMLIDEALALG